jgi:hypothetical protein
MGLKPRADPHTLSISSHLHSSPHLAALEQRAPVPEEDYEHKSAAASPEPMAAAAAPAAAAAAAASPEPTTEEEKHRASVNAHFAAGEADLCREIRAAVQHSDVTPLNAEAGKAAAAQMRRSFTQHDQHKTKVLQDVSRTYKLMLAESTRQADKALAVQRELAAAQLEVQQQALALLRDTSARVMSFIDSNSLFMS